MSTGIRIGKTHASRDRSLRVGPLSVRFRPRAMLAALACAAAALAIAVVLIGSGDYPLGPGKVVDAVFGNGNPADVFIVRELRLPRAGVALLVGAALGLSGAVFQAVVRNPLGSPDLLGFTSGSAAGALVMIVLVGSGAGAVAFGAAAGGLLAGVLVYVLAWRRGVHGFRLVLTGIGVTAILTGVNGYLMTRAKLVEAQRALLWMTGNLDGRDWADVMPLAVAMAVLVPALVIGCGPALRMLEMGDDAAAALGVRVERVRLVLLAGAIVLVALAAAAAGPVSFVALTAPQLARRLTAAPGPNLLPSLFMGAVLLVGSDWIAQRAFSDNPLPVGVVTGLLGGGYLVAMLAAQRRAGRI
ncbi:FecCD family ABC transporter permease [Yinghuangia soli]|uniref:Iron chelate uptake ABC transporter family permease subunit n=1 Tax=Yinghuangia soli TaxID=2908204 RepID=A0AA41U5M3_9ACTN|nr:iron chelate uptake ABC transporter family permease subunit [Yinghuangia soli]MCF2532082.1 iron chelate uptake ABC transporter family permease subunit [Yinghuangia soli]